MIIKSHLNPVVYQRYEAWLILQCHLQHHRHRHVTYQELRQQPKLQLKDEMPLIR